MTAAYFVFSQATLNWSMGIFRCPRQGSNTLIDPRVIASSAKTIRQLFKNELIRRGFSLIPSYFYGCGERLGLCSNRYIFHFQISNY
jgi:hypothetical protein